MSPSKCPNRNFASEIVYRVVTSSGSETWVRHDDSNRQLPGIEADVLAARDPEFGYVPGRKDLLWRVALLLPDAVTASRPLLGAWAGLDLVVYRDPFGAFWTYYFALWTDVLDGMLARSYARVTGRGKELDRWADITCNLFCGIPLLLYSFQESKMGILVVLFFVAVTYLGSMMLFRPHSWQAKVRSGVVRAVQLPALGWLMAPDRWPEAAVASLALAGIAGIYEVNIMLDKFKRKG